MTEFAAMPNDASLPIPRTRLIGRETERATARALLLDESVPLLTLTGPGGSGKTRLALAIARDLAEHFADGVTWVDLAPLADPALVPATVARSLSLLPMPGIPVEEQLVRELRPRQTLLLLDNCEHLLHATSDLTASLLAACPAVQVLATSRAPLHQRGEQEFPVEPFPLPAPGAAPDVLSANDAVRLFVERARGVDPSFALHEANAPTISAICRQLDGLPLAIELAAARMKILSPHALLAEMGERLRLLRGGPRDLPPRHRTIRDTIAWSYALLDPGQQALLRRLAAFTGGWTLDAAAAVAGDPAASREDVLDEIGTLVDQSLVRRVEHGDEPRFTMLETIREFGLAELVAAGEDTAVRDRHAAWVRAMVEALDLHHTMQRDATLMSRLVPEQDNVRQALAWSASRGDALSLNIMSAAMSIVWPSLGQFAEPRRWLHEAMAHDSGVPLLIRARVWHEAAWLAMCQDEIDVAQPLRDEALRLAREAGEPYLLAEAILSAGTLAFWQGELGHAAALLEEGQLAFRAIGAEFAAAPVKAAAAAIFLGNIALIRGDLPAAIQYSEEAIRVSREHGAAAELAYARCGLGYARLLNGAVVDAGACFLDAVAVTWMTGDETFLARLLWAMAAVAVTLEQPEIGAGLIGAADALDARTGGAMWPADRLIADWTLTRLAPALEPAAFANLRRAGAALSAAQAVAASRMVAALALGEDRAAAIWRQAHTAPASDAELDFALTGEPGRSGFDAAPPPLTRREREILELIGQRLSDVDIADRLALEPRAVEMLVGSVLGKLGVANRRDAAAIAARLPRVDAVTTPIRAFPSSPSAAAVDRLKLTPRELDVLRQLFDGHSDREIADALFISRRTVSKHVEAILAKLGVRSRGGAVAAARRLGLAPAAGPDQGR